ncbi:RNA polymerase-associated protein LEO1-like [Condylostylus longicornis]|uniref:RNA polymerase-associated protein LEO1-like n=1 Tax=Condylostylus longicornis TaxID=2530218 RepID=UPI00244E242E|nr:RNA polymerase-associated protein LEO1-like [Condylostylus longicornis]
MFTFTTTTPLPQLMTSTYANLAKAQYRMQQQSLNEPSKVDISEPSLASLKMDHEHDLDINDDSDDIDDVDTSDVGSHIYDESKHNKQSSSTSVIHHHGVPETRELPVHNDVDEHNNEESEHDIMHIPDNEEETEEEEMEEGGGGEEDDARHLHNNPAENENINDEKQQHLDTVQTSHSDDKQQQQQQQQQQQVSSTDSELPSVEQRLKQISQEIEKLGSSEVNNDSDLGRQSFLSLSDLLRTLRPNDKKIPQIDSDYSNTMRVLGESSSLVRKQNSKK